MVWLLKFLIFGHVHKWKEVGRFSLSVQNHYDTTVEKGTRVECVCETCGSHRKFDLT